jgi:hypothetical protein
MIVTQADRLHMGSRIQHTSSPDTVVFGTVATFKWSGDGTELPVGTILAPFAVVEMTPGCTSAAPRLLS